LFVGFKSAWLASGFSFLTELLLLLLLLLSLSLLLSFPSAVLELILVLGAAADAAGLSELPLLLRFATFCS
jgi:hypothetical protein